MNNIYTCVDRFSTLLSTQYILTLGHRNTSVTLHLTFDKEDCFHLMGLQYLKDLAHLKKNRGQIFDDIAVKNIRAETVEKSAFYGEIRDRIELLPYLEDILDSNDTVFKYNENLNAFSRIRAEFLLDHLHEQTRVFVFLSKNTTGNYFCRSFFPMGTTDFSRNQKRWTLLKKVKRNLETGEEIVLYRNPAYREDFGSRDDSEESAESAFT